MYSEIFSSLTKELILEPTNKDIFATKPTLNCTVVNTVVEQFLVF